MNQRSQKVIEVLSVYPEARINGSFEKWSDLYDHTHLAVTPAGLPPTLSEFMALLSSLGGYNNRDTERPPGPIPSGSASAEWSTSPGPGSPSDHQPILMHKRQAVNLALS